MCRLAALLLTASAAFAQTIDGVLVDNVTRTPLPGVIVTLLGPSRYNGTTDEAGAFHIGPVQPGKYLLNIVKAGYLLTQAKRSTMQIDSDLRLTVEMDPLGRLDGRLLYADGVPAAHAHLFLTRQEMDQGRSATADAAGHFEFEDLTPGSYILRGAAAPGVRAPDGDIWVPTWFPNTLDRAAAEPITVVSGAVVTRDFRLRSVPLRHISGLVRDETGQPSAGVTIGVFANEQKVQTAADGSFDLVAYDGTWQISTSRKDGDVERRGRASVLVARHDIENIEIRLCLPFSVQVITESEGPPDPKPSLSMRGIFLSSEDAPISGVLFAMGTKPIEKVYPGRYYVHAFPGGWGLYLDSVKYGDMDVSEHQFEIWDGATPIRVSYRRGAPTVRGLVDSGASAQVVFIPQEEPIRPNRIQSTTAGTRGNFEQSSLPPGDYYVLAFDATDPLRMSNNAVLKTLLPRAEKAHLGKGVTVTLNLKLTPWPSQ
ncbi:MAG TPA: carboxypeptidase-like regulatory domain-containing protein [Candidatus Acidoferrales bacterium]|jgi:hypothetical protein|nr:carboxypeptidase-like regulatory domain-containing protein [Candidatus Acidoferrales bacterium]